MRSATRMAALLLAALLAACTADDPEPATEAPAEEAPEPELELPGGFALEVRRVNEDGWQGRLVIVDLDPALQHLRVLGPTRPGPLATLVASQVPPGPVVAINGGFFSREGEPLGLVRSRGRDASPLGDRGGSGVFIVRDGAPAIVHRDAYRPEGVSEALQSIDRLVAERRSLVNPRRALEGGSNRRAARSAVLIRPNGRLRFAIAFDERSVVSEQDARIVLGVESSGRGPTLAEWAALLARPVREGGLGAVDALGLDGGLSTSLIVKTDARALSIVAHRGTNSAILATPAPRAEAPPLRSPRSAPAIVVTTHVSQLSAAVP